MRNVSIHIYDNHQAVIKGRLDTYDDVDITIEMAISDIREPQSRKTNFTYDFTLPGTKNNKQIFKPVFENDYSITNFNPSKKLDAQIMVDGSPVFTGYLQLVSVDDLEGKIEFNVVFYETLYNFFDDLGEYSLTDIVDLSNFDHLFNRDSIVNSWTNKINYNGQLIDSTNGFGYVYPMEDRGQDQVGSGVLEKNVDYWRPAIYLKTIVDKLFSKYGWSYDSEFFESEYFSKMIVPFGGENLLVSNVANVVNGSLSQSNAGFLATHPINAITVAATKTYGTIPNTAYNSPWYINRWDNDTVAPATDPSDVYSGGTTFECKLGGRYEITARQGFSFKFTQPIYYYGFLNGKSSRDFVLTPGNDGMPYIEAVLQTTSGNILDSGIFRSTDDGTVHSTSYTSSVNLAFNGNYDLQIGERVQIKWKIVIPPGQPWNKGWDFFGNPNTNKNTPTDVSKSIQVFLRKTTTSVESANGNDVQIFTAGLESSNAVSGDYIAINSALPKMKAKDLFTSLNALFNLYWQPVEGEDKKLKIEPYDKFFSINDSLTPFADWTHKLDNNENVNIQPLYELTAKEYMFKYTDDTDWANVDYETSQQASYGQRLIDTNYGLYSDFLTDKASIVPLFSATPLITVEAGSSENIHMPSYTKKDQSGKKSTMNPKARLLFWNGLQTGVNWRMIRYSNDQSGSTLQYDLNETFTHYPFAAHVNDAINPTEDLNYGICERYYWDDWSSVSNNNLFNKYWRNWMNSIIDKDSHLLTATFHLNAVDMANLNLKNFYQVNGVFYRINKLKYSVNNQIAEVELLRAINFPAFKASIGFFSNVLDGGGSPFTPGGGPGGLPSLPRLPPVLGTPSLSPAAFPFTPVPWIGTKLPLPGVVHNTEPVLEEARPTTDVSVRANEPVLELNGLVGYWSTGWQTELPSIGRKPWVDSTQLYPALTPRSQEKMPVYRNNPAPIEGNFFSPSSLIDIKGTANKVTRKLSGPVTINGDGNQMDSGCGGIACFGNRNRITGGVRNTMVIGDDQIVDMSGVVYINGSIFTKDGLQIQKIDIINGSIDEVQNPFNLYKLNTNIIGGINSVKNYGSQSNEDFIFGNITLPKP
jgi:hypothetical protein